MSFGSIFRMNFYQQFLADSILPGHHRSAVKTLLMSATAGSCELREIQHSSGLVDKEADLSLFQAFHFRLSEYREGLS